VTLHVEFGQFDSYGETLDDENDTSELEGDSILISPCARIDEIGGMWTKDDTAESGNGGLADV